MCTDKYYMLGDVKFNYPNDCTKFIQSSYGWGFLSEHVGKKYNRDEIDDLICDMVKSRPYIEGATELNISVYSYKGNGNLGRERSYYQSLYFPNDDYENQRRGSSIKKSTN